MSTQHLRSTPREPRLIISWNADGLIAHDGNPVFISKIRKVARFVNVHDVDLLLIQETHMIPSDIPFVEAQLRTYGFHDYTFYWSTNCNKGWRLKKSRSDQRWHGTGVIVRKGYEPLTLDDNFDGGMWRWSDEEPYQHPIRNPENEGRTLILEYETLYIINTYVPHNGYGSVLKGKCKNNRRKNILRNRWNGRLQHGLTQLLKKKPIIWAGDLNVAHTDLDVSHPMFFANVQESRGKGVRSYTLVTQPGFTRMERENFGYTLAVLDLVDTFRHFNKDKRVYSWEAILHVGDWAKSPIWRDKGMRLDYFICSRSILDRVISSDILDQECSFGSDHRAIALQLKPADESGKVVEWRRRHWLSNSTKKYDS